MPSLAVLSYLICVVHVYVQLAVYIHYVYKPSEISSELPDNDVSINSVNSVSSGEAGDL